MKMVGVALAGGVGVATAVIGTPAAVIGLAGGLVWGTDPLVNGSLALVARSLVWHLYRGPCAEHCPPGMVWDHQWNKCVMAPQTWLV